MYVLGFWFFCVFCGFLGFWVDNPNIYILVYRLVYWGDYMKDDKKRVKLGCGCEVEIVGGWVYFIAVNLGCKWHKVNHT